MFFQTQLRRSPFSASTLSSNSINHHWVISPQRVARCVHTASNIRAAAVHLTATKQKLEEACRKKSTPPDQVLKYLEEIEAASKTSSQVQSTSLYSISLSCFSSHFLLTFLLHPNSLPVVSHYFFQISQRFLMEHGVSCSQFLLLSLPGPTSL
jgi:hypothetical protein